MTTIVSAAYEVEKQRKSVLSIEDVDLIEGRTLGHVVAAHLLPRGDGGQFRERCRSASCDAIDGERPNPHLGERAGLHALRPQQGRDDAHGRGATFPEACLYACPDGRAGASRCRRRQGLPRGSHHRRTFWAGGAVPTECVPLLLTEAAPLP